MASTYMKDKAANWMQPYVDDYMKDVKQSGTKDIGLARSSGADAQVASWSDLSDEHNAVQQRLKYRMTISEPAEEDEIRL